MRVLQIKCLVGDISLITVMDLVQIAMSQLRQHETVKQESRATNMNMVNR